MKKSQNLHGFELIESREITEIKVTAHRYLHTRSHAELIHYACADSNKVFMIGFKTVPENDTGCPHILEHCVLNGSKNYPSKNTFMELLKGSMNTFINAMTSADMTNYPVASTNDKDFMNLMKVYLDAVFYPNIYNQPHIFHQEGWHHELHDADAEIQYRGVVYNEMKGAFSTPESIIMRSNLHAQFPDTPYGFESGGDPETIPELSYEQFLDFHRKYYHPSNSKISLYGDMDIDQVLKVIDAEYLSSFEASPHKVEMPVQKPFAKAKKLDIPYPIEAGKDSSNSYYLALNWTYGKVTDKHLSASMAILAELLMSSPASPLKKVIQESGLAPDSFLTSDGDILQPTMSLVCKQMKQENIEALIKLITKELKRLVHEGFDKKLIEAVLNKREFILREAQTQRFPKGLNYIFSTMGLWIHGGDPIAELAFEPLLAELRRGLSEPYFEELIEKVMLSNKHHSVIIYTPEPGMIARQDALTVARLAEYKKTLKPKQINELLEMNKDLAAWQSEPEKQEELEMIPLLSLDDLEPKSRKYPLIKEVWKEFTLLKHEINTNGIVYLNAYFDLAHAEEADLPWIRLYTQLVEGVNSQNYSYAERSNMIDANTGGIYLHLDLFNNYQDPDEIIPKLIIGGKAVKDKSHELMELASEYALKPLFTDPERIKTLIREYKARAESGIMYAGHGVAIHRMLKPLSQLYHWEDITYGLGYYHFLCDVVESMDKGMTDIIEELDWIKKTFFTTQNLLISLTAGAEDIPVAFKELGALLAPVSQEAYVAVENHYAIRNFNEGIYAPVKVQYVAKGGNFFRKGYSYSGKLRVLNNVINNSYLYQELRVKGGAYGNISSFTPGGYQYFVSYRDPNLRETLDVYDALPEYLRSFDCNKREMDKYIIGDVSHLDYPETPEETGRKADEDYITGFTYEDRQQIRDEVLSTKVEDIRGYADMVESLMSKNHYAVFGSESKVKEAAELFDEVIPALK